MKKFGLLALCVAFGSAAWGSGSEAVAFETQSQSESASFSGVDEENALRAWLEERDVPNSQIDALVENWRNGVAWDSMSEDASPISTTTIREFGQETTISRFVDGSVAEFSTSIPQAASTSGIQTFGVSDCVITPLVGGSQTFGNCKAAFSTGVINLSFRFDQVNLFAQRSLTSPRSESASGIGAQVGSPWFSVNHSGEIRLSVQYTIPKVNMTRTAWVAAFPGPDGPTSRGNA